MRRPLNTDDLAALTGLDRPHLNHAVAALAVHEVAGVGGRARCRYGHLTPRLAALLRTTGDDDRRWSWTYRGSPVEALCRTHGQVLADGGYRGVPESVTPVFDGNRIRRDHVWRRKRRARAEHAIAHLKDWRVLRDHRRHGRHLPDTIAAVAHLHNLRTTLRDIS